MRDDNVPMEDETKCERLGNYTELKMNEYSICVFSLFWIEHDDIFFCNLKDILNSVFNQLIQEYIFVFDFSKCFPGNVLNMHEGESSILLCEIL